MKFTLYLANGPEEGRKIPNDTVPQSLFVPHITKQPTVTTYSPDAIPELLPTTVLRYEFAWFGDSGYADYFLIRERDAGAIAGGAG